MQVMREWILENQHSPTLNCKDVVLLLDLISKDSVAIQICEVVTINFSFVGTVSLNFKISPFVLIYLDRLTSELGY